MKNKELEIISITKIGWACPSEWSVKLDDGRLIYVRYRCARLSMEISKIPTDDPLICEDIIYLWNGIMDDGSDGEMNTLDMLLHLTIAIKGLPSQLELLNEK